MISRAIDTWSAWPTWAKWTSGIGVVVLIDAATTAAGERNFFAGLVEHSAAIVLRYGVMALAIGGAIWLGMLVGKRSKAWLGVVAGIAWFAMVSLVALDLVKTLPASAGASRR